MSLWTNEIRGSVECSVFWITSNYGFNGRLHNWSSISSMGQNSLRDISFAMTAWAKLMSDLGGGLARSMHFGKPLKTWQHGMLKYLWLWSTNVILTSPWGSISTCRPSRSQCRSLDIMPRTLDALQAGVQLKVEEFKFLLWRVTTFLFLCVNHSWIQGNPCPSFALASIILTSFSIVFITGAQNIITLDSLAAGKASALQEAFGARKIKVLSQLANRRVRKWVGQKNANTHRLYSIIIHWTCLDDPWWSLMMIDF